MHDLARYTVVGGVVTKTQRSLGSSESRVRVVSGANAYSPSRDDLRPSSVEHGDSDDGQEVQGLHDGVLESRLNRRWWSAKEVWG
jgi:hypothetical protein